MAYPSDPVEGRGNPDFELPHFQDRCEGGTPLTGERLADIHLYAQRDTDEALMIRELLDEIAILAAERQDKPGARGEFDRRLAELESLTAGLATEVSQVYEMLDVCKDKLGEMVLTLRRMDGRDRRRVRAIEDLTRALTLPHDEESTG